MKYVALSQGQAATTRLIDTRRTTVESNNRIDKGSGKHSLADMSCASQGQRQHCESCDPMVTESQLTPADDQLNRTQEMNHDLGVLEDARSHVSAYLPIGPVVQPITPSHPDAEGHPHAECGRRPHAFRTHLCRTHFQQTVTFSTPRTSVSKQPRAQGNSGGTPPNRRANHFNISDGTCQLGHEKSRNREAAKLEFGAWPFYNTFRVEKQTFDSKIANGLMTSRMETFGYESSAQKNNS